MKHFLIKYRRKDGDGGEWHRQIAAFIAALKADPELNGRIAYRCMKARDGADYYHIATAADDQAIKVLQSREFFTRYTAETKAAAEAAVEVIPLEIIADSAS